MMSKRTAFVACLCVRVSPAWSQPGPIGYQQAEQYIDVGANVITYNKDGSVTEADNGAGVSGGTTTATSEPELAGDDYAQLVRAFGGGPAPCPADLVDDGYLNFFDISAFLVAFNAGCPETRQRVTISKTSPLGVISLYARLPHFCRV